MPRTKHSIHKPKRRTSSHSKPMRSVSTSVSHGLRKRRPVLKFRRSAETKEIEEIDDPHASWISLFSNELERIQQLPEIEQARAYWLLLQQLESAANKDTYKADAAQDTLIHMSEDRYLPMWVRREAKKFLDFRRGYETTLPNIR